MFVNFIIKIQIWNNNINNYKIDTNGLDKSKILLNKTIKFATENLPKDGYHHTYQLNDLQSYKDLLYVAKYHNCVRFPHSSNHHRPYLIK